MMVFRLSLFAAAIAAVAHGDVNAENPVPAPEEGDGPAPAGEVTTIKPPTPAPDSTSSAHDVTFDPDAPAGTCCKLKNPDGSCADVSGDLELYNHQWAVGSNTWCGSDFCECGELSPSEACGYGCGYNYLNDPTRDPQACLCAADCVNEVDNPGSEQCCEDFYTVCPQTTETTTLEFNPAPAPLTTTTVFRTTTANNTVEIAEGDNMVAIVVSVVVVVIIVIVVVVIFSIKHIRQRQADSRPLFAISTGNESPSNAGGDVELSTRSKAYASGRRRNKTSPKETPKTYLGAAPVAGHDDPGAAEAGKRKSRRSKGKGKAKPDKTVDAHPDVFASPTHQNFEL